MNYALVTGGSRGIGKAICLQLAKQGFNILINYTSNESAALETKKLIEKENITANLIKFDVSNRKAVREALSNWHNENSDQQISVLVNNAGIFEPKPFLEVQEEDIDRFLSTNLKGTFFTSQAVIPPMMEQGGGVIINIGTVLVDHAIAGFPATAPISSKGAIHAFTRQLAAEFGKYNIKVNTIAPGIIRSPLQSKIGVEDADSLAGLHLLDRIGEPQEIAEAVEYLASAAFVTGETINVAGGHTVGHAI